MKTFNLLLTCMYQEDDIKLQCEEEFYMKNAIARLVMSRGYKFAIADDKIIDERIKLSPDTIT